MTKLLPSTRLVIAILAALFIGRIVYMSAAAIGSTLGALLTGTR
jgi:hypothetical protein